MNEKGVSFLRVDHNILLTQNCVIYATSSLATQVSSTVNLGAEGKIERGILATLLRILTLVAYRELVIRKGMMMMMNVMTNKLEVKWNDANDLQNNN